MPLSLVIAPHAALQTPAKGVDPLSPEIHHLVKTLCDEVVRYEAFGFNAPMFGLSQQIAVVRSNREDTDFLVLLNPQIQNQSSEKQVYEEASPSFPGINAQITRPSKITMAYQNMQGENQFQEFEGFLSTVIQHQIDNLQGRCFLDHLSPLKKQLLIKKMEQTKKVMKRQHVHGPHCHH